MGTMAATIDPINEWLVDEMRCEWGRNPESVDPSWRALFENGRERLGARSPLQFTIDDPIDVASTLVAAATRRVPAPDRVQGGSLALDVQFVLDTTGLRGEEITRLRGNTTLIAEQIAALPSVPDVRFGATVYRTEGARFVAQTLDFTDDLDSILGALAEVTSCTGDHPEVVHDALDLAFERSSWRGGNAVELLILGADAASRADCDARLAYTQAAPDSSPGAVKVLPVTESDVDTPAEFVMRELGFATGGHFVFIAYGGDAPEPCDGSLDRLLVPLLDHEILALTRATRSA